MLITLKAGTVLYHGTSSEDLDDECDRLDGPAWLSSSKVVAQYFASRGGNGGIPRIITYSLSEDVQLHEIRSQREMQIFAEEHDICLFGVDEMRESVECSGIPGWVIPQNYPDGDDILLVDTRVLDFIATEPC